MEIRYVVLGLLTQRSMTGYAMKALFDRLSWLGDSPSYGSLYPILHALHELEWVTVEIIPNESKPPRKVYSITPKGQDALQEWLNAPPPAKFSTKLFMMWLILAHNFSKDSLKHYLQVRQKQIGDYLTEYGQKTYRDNAGQIGDLKLEIVDDYGRALAKAELEWLERKLAQLEQNAMTFGGLELTDMHS